MTNEPAAGAIFSIGTQHAGAIYQTAGDQFINHTQGTTSEAPLALLSELRAAVSAAAAGLSAAEQQQAAEALATVENELQGPDVDKRRAAHSLTRVAKILQQAGQLAGAVQALHQLAAWLEPGGSGLLRCL
jgi:hypothetical protein